MGQTISVQSYDLTHSPTEPSFALAQFTVEETMKFWPGIEEMLDRVPHTWKYWTKDWIREAIALGSLQVWGIGPPPKAVFVFFTQVAIYPNGKVLLVPWGAGSFDPEMMGLLHATLVNYAKVQDCTTIEIRGRPGWEKYFTGVGMKREHVTWTLPVPNMRVH